MALQFDNSNTGTITLVQTTTASYTLTWPSADGTTGQILQTDASGNLSWVTPASSSITQFSFVLNTSSPNATINVGSIIPVTTSTDGAFALIPKTSGFISFSTPDGTTTGGNSRGTYSVDYTLPGARRTAADVAQGAGSVLMAYNSAAEGDYSVVIGGQNNATGGGNGHQVIVGSTNVARAGEYSTVLGVNYYNGGGNYALATVGNAPYTSCDYSWVVGGYGGDSYSNSPYAWGRTQAFRANYNAITTTTATTYLTTKGGVSNAQLATLAQVFTPDGGGAYGIEVEIVANATSGTSGAAFEITALMKWNSGPATGAFVGTPTVTTLYQDAALSGISVAIGIDNVQTRTFWISVVGLTATTIGWNAYVTVICNKPVGA